MKKTLVQLTAIFVTLLTVSFVIVVINQTAQLVDLAARFDPTFGQFVAWAALAFFIIITVTPLVMWLRLPAPLTPPEEGDEDAYVAHMRLLGARLRRNPLLKGDTLESVEQVEAALAKLDAEADRLTKTAGMRVFLATAVSQNGAFDALIVLGVQTKLVWEIAHVYHQRPTAREIAKVYRNVAFSAFVATQLDEAEIAEQLQPVLTSMGPSLLGGVAGMHHISLVLVNSALSGGSNAFLTLRVGLIARELSKARVRRDSNALRRFVIPEALAMLTEITISGTKKVSVAAVIASKRAATDAASGAVGKAQDAGRKAQEAGEKLYKAVAFWEKEVEKSETEQAEGAGG
jgi:hypothetical protein